MFCTKHWNQRSEGDMNTHPTIAHSVERIRVGSAIPFCLCTNEELIGIPSPSHSAVPFRTQPNAAESKFFVRTGSKAAEVETLPE